MGVIRFALFFPLTLGVPLFFPASPSPPPLPVTMVSNPVQTGLRICCIGAGYVGGPTMAMMALKCPEVTVTVCVAEEGALATSAGLCVSPAFDKATVGRPAGSDRRLRSAVTQIVCGCAAFRARGLMDVDRERLGFQWDACPRNANLLCLTCVTHPGLYIRFAVVSFCGRYVPTDCFLSPPPTL